MIRLATFAAAALALLLHSAPADAGPSCVGHEFVQDFSYGNLSAPRVNVSPGDTSAVSGEVINFTMTAESGSGGELFHFWCITGGELVAANNPYYTVVRWKAPEIPEDDERMYVVTAYAGDGNGLVGVERSVITVNAVEPCTIPDRPTIIEISNLRANGYWLEWSEIEGEDYYELQEDVDSGFSDPRSINNGGSNDPNMYVQNAVNGTYYLRVRGVNECGEGEWSATRQVVVSVNRRPDRPTCISPAHLSVDRPLDLTLQWAGNHPEGDPLTYEVLFRTGDGSQFFRNDAVYNGTGTSAPVGPLEWATQYAWRIESTDPDGQTQTSTVCTFQTLGDAEPPLGSLILDDGAASSGDFDVVIGISASDADSGVTRMRFSNDGEDWSVWIAFQELYSWNLLTDDGGSARADRTYTVYGQVLDSEGNESTVFSDQIEVEPAPECVVILNGQVYANLREALAAAVPGDTVHITEGVCTIRADYAPPRYPSQNVGIVVPDGVALVGAGADRSTLRADAWVFAVADGDGSTISGLTIINDHNANAVWMESNNSVLEDCIIRDTYEGVQVTEEASGVAIRRNLIAFNGGGIRTSASTGIEIVNNTIVNNTNLGVLAYVPPSRFANNIVTGNGGDGVYIDDATVVWNNDVWNNSHNYNPIGDQTGTRGNISTDPRFNSPAGGNYGLASGSPCIDSGLDVGLPAVGAPDIGAYERGGSGAIQVTCNHEEAEYTLTGPVELTGSGLSSSFTTQPPGSYTIAFYDVPNFYSPHYTTGVLFSGETLDFDCTYIEDAVGPTGELIVNFGEFATDQTTAVVIIEAQDEVAGIGEASELELSNDGITWSPTRPFTTLVSDWTLTDFGADDAAGERTIFVRVSDQLGNQSVLGPASIRYLPDRAIHMVPTEYATVPAALAAATSGDLVFVEPGVYDAYFDSRVPDGVRLQGAGPGVTTLLAHIDLGSEATLDGVDLTGGYRVVQRQGSGVTRISNNVIRTQGATAAVDFVNSPGQVLLWNNVLVDEDASDFGIMTWPGDWSGRATNTVFAGFDAGVYVSGDVRSLLFRNCIFHDLDNVISAVVLWDGHTRLRFERNLTWAIAGDFSKQEETRYIQNERPLVGDPRFSDTGSFDFTLGTGSAAINAGLEGAAYEDSDGSRNDLGAYGGPAANRPPVAVLTLDAIDVARGEVVNVDASSSFDAETPADALRYRWDLDGDGEWDTSFGDVQAHELTFDAPGTVEFTVQVLDSGWFVSEATETVEVVNNPPSQAFDPRPTERTIDVPLEVTLEWDGYDADGDDLVYDVYLGTSAEALTVRSAGLDALSYDLGVLEYDTTYFWRVDSTDTLDALTMGPVWWFTTRPENFVPVAHGTATVIGCAPTGPVTVRFDGTTSTDGDEDPLTYAWDIGGESRAGEVVEADVEPDSVEVSLTVNDGAVDSQSYRFTVPVEPFDCSTLDVICEQYTCGGDGLCSLGFAPTTLICEADAAYEYGCPDGTGCEADLSIRFRNRHCSGDSYACDGDYGAWKDWRTDTECSVVQACDAGAGACVATDACLTGWCNACGDESECPDGWNCLIWTDYPEISWCTPPCRWDDDCPDGAGCFPQDSGYWCEPAAPDLGCYESKVWLVDGCGNPLELSETCDEGDVCNEGACVCDDDDLEPNDALEDAAEVEEGTNDDIAACSGNTDFYRIYVDDEDLLSVEIAFTHADGDLDLKLLDGAGETLDESVNAEDNEYVEFLADADGDIFIQVYWHEDVRNRYDLTVEIEPCSPVCPTCAATSIEDGCGESCPVTCGGNCEGDECVCGGAGCVCVADDLEPNDEQSEAESIESGEIANLTVCAADDDWFRIFVGSYNTLTVNLTFEHESGDLDLELLDSNLDVVALADSSDSDESANHIAATDDDLFIHVFGVDGDENVYSLNASVTQCVADCNGCTDPESDDGCGEACGDRCVPSCPDGSCDAGDASTSDADDMGLDGEDETIAGELSDAEEPKGCGCDIASTRGRLNVPFVLVCTLVGSIAVTRRRRRAG